VTWNGGCFPDAPYDVGARRPSAFAGYSIGQAVGQDQTQNNYFGARPISPFSFDKGGRLDVKIGGEYVRQATYILWCATCTWNPGRDQRTGPANIESLFPFGTTRRRGILPLSSISRRFTMNVSTRGFSLTRCLRNLYGCLGMQDDLEGHSLLTLKSRASATNVAG
jgi:hypothetical protein